MLVCSGIPFQKFVTIPGSGYLILNQRNVFRVIDPKDGILVEQFTITGLGWPPNKTPDCSYMVVHPVEHRLYYQQWQINNEHLYLMYIDLPIAWFLPITLSHKPYDVFSDCLGWFDSLS